MVKRAVLETEDQNRFELGIAALLFLLGFSPAVQLETDSPDLIVATTGGRVILIECTLRVADFSMKLGKLVDRRRALSKTYESASHYAEVHAVLVCALPKDQIAVRHQELKDHQVYLITKDELSSAFNRLTFAPNPDALLEELINQNSGNKLI